MAVHEIIRMGHPTLRQVARQVDPAWIGSHEFDALIEDMQDTLNAAGGIGLAAPQINVPLQIAIVHLPGGEGRYGEIPEVPLTVFVNPEISVLDKAAAGCWEGCLSVPGLRGYVERPQHIRVDYFDEHAHERSIEAQGFLATVIQHELDHLAGRLYVDLIEDSRLLAYEREFVQFGLGESCNPSSVIR